MDSEHPIKLTPNRHVNTSDQQWIDHDLGNCVPAECPFCSQPDLFLEYALDRMSEEH